MTTYYITGKVTVSCWTTVEADSEEEALEIAKNRELAGFEISGSYPENDCFHLDNDGIPYDLSIYD